ncbi:MAG: arginine repressor [Suipraeoptans sp.]
MKVNRRQKILEIIDKYPVETQEELTDYLKNEGILTTQATISRDIRDLKLTKVPTNDGRQRYSILNKNNQETHTRYLRVLREGFVSVDIAQNILVVKTVSGMAMAVAAAIDALDWDEVVGCIAGDDTIMCAIRTNEDAQMISGKISKIVM